MKTPRGKRAGPGKLLLAGRQFSGFLMPICGDHSCKCNKIIPRCLCVVKCQHLQCTNVKADSQQHASRKGHWIAAVSVGNFLAVHLPM